jgi:hypothetical protein
MTYLYTNTTQSAATNTGLSTQIVIKVDGQSVGAVQTLTSNQNRPLRRIQEVGTDGVIEIVPNNATNVDLNINRIVFDRKRLPEAFSRGFLNIHAQRIPFDIFVFDFSSVEPDTLDATFDITTNDNVVTTIYENCWFNTLTTTYNATDYIITETATCWAEFVHSYINGDPNQNAAVRSFPTNDDALERLADTNRRGSLDARGLTRVGEIFFGDNP